MMRTGDPETMRRIALLVIFCATSALAAPPFESSKAPYVNSSGVTRGAITATDFKPVAGDVYIYVATTGSDANPGTQAAPLQTIAAAIAKAPSMWLGQCRIMLSAGTWSISSLAIKAGMPLGQAAPFVLQGTMVDSGLGTRTISSVTLAASGASPTQYVVAIKDNTLAPTLNQYDGYFLRITSGAASGIRRMIVSNTVGGEFSLNLGDIGSRPAIGDTFVIEAPGSIISHSGIVTLDAVGMRNQVGMVVSGVKFAGTGSGSLKVATRVSANTVQVTMGNNQTISIYPGASLNGDGYDSVDIGVNDLLAVNYYGSGVYVSGSSTYVVFVGRGAQLKGKFVTRGGAILVSSSGYASLTNFNCQGASSYCLALDAAAWDHLTEYGVVGRLTNTGAQPVIKMNQSVGRLVAGLDISNCGYTAITMQTGSAVYYHGSITGTGCAGYGLALEAGSIALVSTSSGANSLAGASGEVGVFGDQTVTGTWAGVIGGTPVHNDIGGTITKNYGP